MYKKLINKRMYSNKFKIDKRVNNFSNIFIKELLLLYIYVITIRPKAMLPNAILQSKVSLVSRVLVHIFVD